MEIAPVEYLVEAIGRREGWEGENGILITAAVIGSAIEIENFRKDRRQPAPPIIKIPSDQTWGFNVELDKFLGVD